jgi:preprotein translocase subunit YajC
MLAVLFAQAGTPAPAAQQELPFLMRPEVMIGLMALFFIVVILPQSRRAKKEQAAMMANLKAGSKVVTASGIVGTVVTMKDGEDEITLKSADTKLKVLRSSVTKVLGQDDETKAA